MMFAEFCTLPHRPAETSFFDNEPAVLDAVDIRRPMWPTDVDSCRMLHDLDMQPPSLNALLSGHCNERSRNVNTGRSV